MADVFRSTIAHNLQDTLEGIIDDDDDGVKSSMYRNDWADSETMDGAYIDFLEMSGPALATEKPEGVDMDPGELREGYFHRVLARTFALQIGITEEAMEDGKRKEAIRLAARLKRALYKTQDIDMTNMLVRAWNTAYVYGDGLPMFSTSHTLANGGTFSNTLATPIAASRSAIIVMRALVRKLPDHTGVTEGYTLKQIICPVEQETIWEGVLGSEKVPESDFNEINVVKRMKLGLTAIPYWSNTATNFAVKTSAEGGPCFYTRRAPRSRTWVNESQEVMRYGISARWARTMTDARSMFGSQA